MAEKKSGGVARVVRIVVTLAVVLVVVFASWKALSYVGGGVFGVGSNTFSEGYRDVYIRKVTSKGTAVKVYEVEAGYHGTSTVVVQGESLGDAAWRANFDEQAIADQLTDCRGDELVRCWYRERYISGLYTTSYLITKVEKVNAILAR